jgi:hypothetical protein
MSKGQDLKLWLLGPGGSDEQMHSYTSDFTKKQQPELCKTDTDLVFIFTPRVKI